MIKTKRTYDPAARGDGYRLLTMRLWPRGVRKDAVDRWEKELGPSVELLRAYRDGEIESREFARRYRAEMRDKRELLDEVRRTRAAPKRDGALRRRGRIAVSPDAAAGDGGGPVDSAPT